MIEYKQSSNNVEIKQKNDILIVILTHGNVKIFLMNRYQDDEIMNDFVSSLRSQLSRGTVNENELER